MLSLLGNPSQNTKKQTSNKKISHESGEIGLGFYLVQTVWLEVAYNSQNIHHKIPSFTQVLPK